MQKKTGKKKAAKAKSFFRKAGEVLGTIGHELVEGKEKVVEVSQTILEGISHTITPVKKSAAKKTVKKVVKRAVKKIKPAKAVAKKTITKSVKKAVKKTPVKKQLKKAQSRRKKIK